MPPTPQAGPTPRFDLDAVIREAASRSPTFAATKQRIASWPFSLGAWGAGSNTNTAISHTFIDPSLTPEQALVQVMYEAQNAFFAADLQAVDHKMRAGGFANGVDYAKAIIKEETGSAVVAAIEAIEAGVSYWPALEAIVKKHTVKTPSGKLEFKPGESLTANQEAYPIVLKSAQSVDTKTHQTRSALDNYAAKWQEWHDLNATPKQPAPTPPRARRLLNFLFQRTDSSAAAEQLQQFQLQQTRLDELVRSQVTRQQLSTHLMTQQQELIDQMRQQQLDQQLLQQQTIQHLNEQQETLRHIGQQQALGSLTQQTLNQIQQQHSIHSQLLLHQLTQNQTQLHQFDGWRDQFAQQQQRLLEQHQQQQQLSQQCLRASEPRWYSNVAPPDMNDLNRRWPMP